MMMTTMTMMIMKVTIEHSVSVLQKIQMIPSRSEFHFPEDSVEAVQPRTVKRRRYTHKQLGEILFK